MNKFIPINERLILALDVENVTKARQVIAALGDEVQFYKIGLELLMGGDYFTLLKELKDAGKKVFVDLKFFDVPRTVGAAVRELNRWGVDYATVHGNDEIMKSAADASDGVKILAVTALTSLDRGDLDDLGFACDVEALVLSRAKRALELGCAGVISSGLEVGKLREHLGGKLVVITPGIRPVANVEDDQKRVVTPTDAFRNGADHIVVGRPVLQADDMRKAAKDMQAEIANFFA